MKAALQHPSSPRFLSNWLRSSPSVAIQRYFVLMTVRDYIALLRFSLAGPSGPALPLAALRRWRSGDVEILAGPSGPALRAQLLLLRAHLAVEILA
ncbi:hypothetical protein [Nocardia sp. CDC160]|uniref:hypothetical protein n=1 Tax=Nocardia sp. CDC160 TaxID=3112166 RepID=UPI002DB62DE9|nr:hypothetical protein [Nocardia sp. CDC160]MEC3915970.1 hypothetical protein [Nocardia sp. CDC160]